MKRVWNTMPMLRDKSKESCPGGLFSYHMTRVLPDGRSAAIGVVFTQREPRQYRAITLRAKRAELRDMVADLTSDAWHSVTDNFPPDRVLVDTITRMGERVSLRHFVGAWSYADGRMRMADEPVKWRFIETQGGDYE